MFNSYFIVQVEYIYCYEKNPVHMNKFDTIS